MQKIRILDPEKFDTSLRPCSLLNNVQHLGEFLTNQKNLKHINEITMIIDFIIDHDKLMNTNKEHLQIELCICFIQFFGIIGATREIDHVLAKYLYRFFNLICIVISPLRRYTNLDANNNVSEAEWQNISCFDDRKNILILMNEFDIFSRINDSNSFQRVFNTLIKIDLPEATSCLAKLMNNSNIINLSKRNAFLAIYDAIDLEYDEFKEKRNKSIVNFIRQLDETARSEIIQNIRGILTGIKIYSIYKKLLSILEIDPYSIISFAEFDYNNEDDQIRNISLDLAKNEFGKLKFSIEMIDKYRLMFERHSDRSPKNRIIVIKFAFDLFKKSINQSNQKNINSDILGSAVKEVHDIFWNTIIKERIIDKSNEVRLTVINELNDLSSKNINQENIHIISYRLKDKCQSVRLACLDLMIKINNEQPEIINWLIFDLIEMYPIINDISLYGFSIFIQNRSLIKIAKDINNRTNLLKILDVITNFRKLMQEYLLNDHSENLEKELEKYCKIQVVNQVINAVPKNFFENAQRKDSKYRDKLFRNLKKKIKAETALKFLGLYQPSPIEPLEIISQKDFKLLSDECNFQIIKDLAKIYSSDLVLEIPSLLQNLDEINLLILASLKNEDRLIEVKQRKNILKALLSLICDSELDIDNRKKEFALKAFAKLIRKEQSSLIKKIKFKSKEFDQKLTFFGHFVDQELIPSYVYDEIEKNLNEITTEKMVKYALRISSNENSMRSTNIHQHFIENSPDIAFDSFVNNCAPNNNSFVLEPDVFRTFSSLIQHKNSDIREKVITSLSLSLKKSNTPIQFLCYFALSATDPYEPNRLKAKQELESAILWRKELVHHYLDQNQNLKTRKTNNFDNMNELICSIPKNINIETTIPYLIYILMHHPDFDADLPDLHSFSLYLKFYFDPICNKEANISRLLDILLNLQTLQDLEDNDDNLKFTEKMYLLCEIGSRILKRIGSGREWGPNMEEAFEFSARYFKSANSNENLKKMLSKKEHNQYSFQKVSEKKMLCAGMSTKSSKARKGKSFVEYDEQEADSESDYYNYIPTSKRILPLSPTFIGKVLTKF